jgi:protein-S-isoprenylcysteine O-methyltransferase Ste14
MSLTSRSGVASPVQRSFGGRGGGWVAAQAAVIVGIVLCEALGPGWPRSAARALAAAGVVVAGMGILLFLAGAIGLGRLLTPFPKPRNDGSLREGGAYAIVRHPMYGGVILGFAGWSLAATPLGLAATALGALFLELKTRREEAWLVEEYSSYAAYRRRVRWKFVPGVR